LFFALGFARRGTPHVPAMVELGDFQEMWTQPGLQMDGYAQPGLQHDGWTQPRLQMDTQCFGAVSNSDAQNSGVTSNWENARSSGGSGYTPRQKPGDWSCPSCHDLQFARNLSCRKCGQANPDQEASMAATSGSGYGMRTEKPGDWYCPSCHDLQFARNAQCRKCGEANPSGGSGKPGDWLCPSCGDLQFSRNTSCRRCDTLNPAVADGTHQGMTSKAGDWHCPNCNDLQFARNRECRKCHTPNPDPEGSLALMEEGMAARVQNMSPGTGFVHFAAICSSLETLRAANVKIQIRTPMPVAQL